MEAVVRYERQKPGELIHLDTKKLGRIDRDRPPHLRRPARSEQSTWPPQRAGMASAARLHRRCLPASPYRSLSDEKKEREDSFVCERN